MIDRSKLMALALVLGLAATLIDVCAWLYILPLIFGPLLHAQLFELLIPIWLAPVGLSLTVLLVVAAHLGRGDRRPRYLAGWLGLMACWLIASLGFFLWSYLFGPLFGVAWPGIMLPVPSRIIAVELLGAGCFFTLAYALLSTLLAVRFSAIKLVSCAVVTIMAAFSTTYVSTMWIQIAALILLHIVVANAFIPELDRPLL